MVSMHPWWHEYCIIFNAASSYFSVSLISVAVLWNPCQTREDLRESKTKLAILWYEFCMTSIVKTLHLSSTMEYCFTKKAATSYKISIPGNQFGSVWPEFTMIALTRRLGVRSQKSWKLEARGFVKWSGSDYSLFEYPNPIPAKFRPRI
jgi:hypothetical protein